MTIKVTVTDIDSGLSMDGLPLRSWPLASYNNAAHVGQLLADYLVDSGHANQLHWSNDIYISAIENAHHQLITYPVSFEYVPEDNRYVLNIGCQTYTTIESLANRIDHSVMTASDDDKIASIMRDLIMPTALLLLPTYVTGNGYAYGDYDELIDMINAVVDGQYSHIAALIQSIMDHEMTREATWNDTRTDSRAIVAIDLAVAYGYGIEAVYAANHNYLTAVYGPSLGKHGTYVIDLMDQDENTLSSLLYDLDRLHDYPVFDEDELSQVESNWLDESWPGLARDVDWSILFLRNDLPVDELPKFYQFDQVCYMLSRVSEQLNGHTQSHAYYPETCEYIDGGCWIYDWYKINEILTSLVTSITRHAFMLDEPVSVMVLRSWEGVGYYSMLKDSDNER